MGRARNAGGDPNDEYHSYVMRVRMRSTRLQPTATVGLSIRVEYVNARKAKHFNELSVALDFIADSVRRNLLHPET